MSTKNNFNSWSSAKTIKDIAIAYSSIYEANKLDPVGQEDSDIDNDGKKNTKTDKYLLNRRKVRSAAINAKEETERRKLGEAYDIVNILTSYLLENNFAETEYDANIIIGNMSENWMIEILNEYED